jgi:hypothetical protein
MRLHACFYVFQGPSPGFSQTWTCVLVRIHKQMTTTMRSQPVLI